MHALGKIAVLVEEFSLGSAAQQLLDRFLLGYPRGGDFHRPAHEAVTIYSASHAHDELIEQRATDFHLRRAAEAASAAAEADAVFVIPRGSGETPAEALTAAALDASQAGSKLFVHGVLAASVAAAQAMTEKARSRRITLLAGGCLPTTWRLPSVDLESGTELAEAVIVVVGPPGEAEWLGLDGLQPFVERRHGGESGVRSLRAFSGDAVWRAMQEGPWSAELMASAISRTDTPQGDALADGRTQDLVALGMVPKLAKNPVAYVMEFRDGLRATILVLNGVIADINVALATRSGQILSTQLYRPPSPNAHHWSTLAEVLEQFFTSGTAPWPIERSVLTAGLAASLKEARAQQGAVLETPELAIPYRAAHASAFVRH